MEISKGAIQNAVKQVVMLNPGLDLALIKPRHKVRDSKIVKSVQDGNIEVIYDPPL